MPLQSGAAIRRLMAVVATRPSVPRTIGGVPPKRVRDIHGYRQGRPGAERRRTHSDHHRGRAVGRLRVAHYRGLGGLYNGETEDGLPIEVALSGPTLRRDPALCWKYLAEIGRACLQAEPNAGHVAIAELQRRKPGAWVLTQNIDGFHRRAGSPPDRLIEIHGQLSPLSCMGCG